MNMEEIRQSLAQARLRCLLLEADKEAEVLRASKYRGILSELVGEGGTCANAPHRPQASGLDLMPWDTSAHSTSPALSSYFVRNRLTVPEPQNQPAATVPELHAPIEGPCPGGSTGTCTSPPDRRNLNSTSRAGSGSVQNLMRASSSRNTASQQTANPVNDVSNMTDGQRSVVQRSAPVPSPSASRQGPRGSTNSTSLPEIFTRVGVTPFELTRDEIVRVNETPGISWQTFSGKFGGHRRSEWPNCDRIPGYTKFLCVDITAQPYMPTAPGKPGLVIRLPTTDLTSRDDGRPFHVFSLRDGLLYYQGEYARTHLQVELNWNDLSWVCKDMWMKRITGSGRRHMAVLHTLKARIILRSKFKREPSSTEVDGFLMSDLNSDLPYRVVSAAFRAGEEKMICEAVQCIGYDSNLATIVQRNAREAAA